MLWIKTINNPCGYTTSEIQGHSTDKNLSRKTQLTVNTPSNRTILYAVLQKPYIKWKHNFTFSIEMQSPPKVIEYRHGKNIISNKQSTAIFCKNEKGKQDQIHSDKTAEHIIAAYAHQTGKHQ